MTDLTCIFQCGNRLADDTSTKEHVVLNAIGGRKTVTGFICNDCNHETGTTWDAELARQLNPLSLLLGISRQRKGVPSQVFPTSSGGKIQLRSDGRMTIGEPSHEVATDGSTTRLKITARSLEELRNLIKGMRRKYPSLKNQSLDDLMSHAKAGRFYSPDLTEITLDFGGPAAGRSLVKSAVALVYDAGVDPNVCDLALDYLLNESAKPCFGYYYDEAKDLVLNRPVERPFHCVYVEGHSDTGTILGYVEFYSLHRMVLCLSKSYSGKDFANLYAIDPVKGEELSVEVDLDLSMSDIHSAFEYEKFDETVRNSAIVDLFNYIVKVDFDRALDRAVGDAFEYAFENCDAEHGAHLTSEQLRQLMEDAIEKLTPFIIHNADRFSSGLRDMSEPTR